jgi:hypothetical protein
MALHRETWDRLDGFARSFGMIYEDVDLGWRLTLLGGRVMLVPQSVVRHREHASLGQLPLEEKLPYWELNALRLAWRVYDQKRLERVWPALLGLLRARRNSLVAGHAWASKGLCSCVAALGSSRRLNLLRTFNQILAKALVIPDQQATARAHIQATRVVADEEIISRFMPEPFLIWSVSEAFRQRLRRSGYCQILDRWLDRRQLRELFVLR